MYQPKDQRKNAKRNRDAVRGNNRLADREEPAAKRRCVRDSTRRQTVQQSKDAQHKHRIPRKQYQEEVERNEQYAEELKKTKIEMAQDKKVIWNGSRKQIGWTSDTIKTFWANHNHGGWLCSSKIPGKCTALALQNHHKNLAIGHKVSFYRHIGEECDAKVFCDGTNHWQGYRRSDVIAVNEDLDNLEPQCKACNGNTHTEGVGGYEPQKLRDVKCRGANQCSAEYFITDDGSLITTKERKRMAAEEEEDSSAQSDDSEIKSENSSDEESEDAPRKPEKIVTSGSDSDDY